MTPIADPAAEVRHLLSQLTTVPPADIRPTDHLRRDLGLDSVAAMELVSMLAERHDIDLELEDALQIETVEQCVALLGERFGVR